MLSSSQPVDASHISLGHRRDSSDLARIALDLTWASQRAEYKAITPSRAYPSPPMSGSPPLPPKATQEAGDRGRIPGGYPTANPQDAYRGPSNQQLQTEPRGPPNMSSSLPRLFQQDSQERMPYGYQRSEEPHSRPSQYPPPGGPGMPHQQSYLPGGGSSAGAPYAAPNRPPTAENQQMSSPKSQRKTKGHVASACVPCKRAHLRCDAQRPCSRCLSNGKEDSCVDVQHKKRGRPRLRDDRDARYDSSRFPHPQDVALRRPLSIYPSGGSISSGYEDPLRRVQSYRVLKSQPSEPMGPRFLNQGSASDVNVYAAPLSITTRPPEPVAFLNMKMEFAKVSPVFADALGGVDVQGRNLSDVVVSSDRDKVLAIRSQLHDEQTRLEPNYLPPILGRLDHIIQGLGFSAEEIGRFQLERQYYLAFNGSIGRPRNHLVRLGLAKEGSIYFVVLFLDLHAQFSHQIPPHLSQDASQAYGSQPPTPQSSYGQHTPVSATFDPARPRYGDVGLSSRPHPGLSVPIQPNLSPGNGPGVPSYAASPSRPEYPGPSSYQIPRSELSPVTRPPPRPAYQLPPIRAQPGQGAPPGEQAWGREDRSSRVDIGGLIDKPDTPGRLH